MRANNWGLVQLEWSTNKKGKGNNAYSSLNIGLVLLATLSILSHIGTILALLARRSGKTVVGRNYA